MSKIKKPTSVEMPNGEVRMLIQRVVYVNHDRLTSTLGEVVAYWQSLLDQFPADAVVQDNTPHEQAEFHLAYVTPETNAEYDDRLLIEAHRQALIEKERQANLTESIQKRLKSPRKLTPKQELKLLADLKAKYPEA